MPYSPAFLAQIDKTLAFEGGYVNDPDDPGGGTNMGISARSYPQFDIPTLTRTTATSIYWMDFWLPSFCEDIARACPVSAGKVFDMSVNMGQSRAGRILQAELNRYCRCNLVVDGKIGPRTVAAAQGSADPDLLSWLRLGAEAYYRELAASHPVMLKYLRGWLRRAAA
jgi:lysozyme family protein